MDIKLATAGRIAARTAIAELDTEITAFLANPTTVSAAEDLLAKVRLRDQATRPYDEAVVKHLTDDTEITTEISRTMEYYDLMDKLKRDLRRCIDQCLHKINRNDFEIKIKIT